MPLQYAHAFFARKATAICLDLIGNAQLHCSAIGGNADDWAVVSVGVLYMVRVERHMMEKLVSGYGPRLLEQDILMLK